MAQLPHAYWRAAAEGGLPQGTTGADRDFGIQAAYALGHFFQQPMGEGLSD